MSIANPQALKESQLQKAILELAQRLGWRVAHFRTSKAESGAYLTAQSGHLGFPDLVLLRPPRLVFAELKSVKGRLSVEQGLWLNGLKTVAGVETFCWRPDDWTSGTIEAVLR